MAYRYHTSLIFMKQKLVLLILFILMGSSSSPQDMPEVSSGKIIRLENFESKYVDPRNIDIWLPDDYSSSNKYAVLFMHDGQMLFDSTLTWNNQEWEVDEVMTELFKEQKINDCIVVGIWNNDEYRSSEYFPQYILKYLPENIRDTIIQYQLENKTQSDAYLKFIVEELKPYVDNNFSVFKNPENTFIMGSSMGGLISIFALCEYPDVFGGAGCISTHWPMVTDEILNPQLAEAAFTQFYDYLDNHIPPPGKNKIYYDYGTETLDSLYKPFQLQVDELMIQKGYNSDNWVTLEFVGEEHTERSWSKRVAIPLEFLLKK